MRAYSLTELMAGALITMILASNLISIQRILVHSTVKQRKLLSCERQLDLAWAKVHHLVENTEPAFWQAFPVRNNFGEASHLSHGAVHYRNRCATERDTPCLTVWDIKLRDTRAPVHEVTGGDLPYRLDLSYTSDQGPHAESMQAAQAGDVILVKGTLTQFCALIQEVSHGLVFLAPTREQPWLLPQALPIDEPFEAILLGQARYFHIFLDGDAQAPQRQRLFYRNHFYSGHTWLSSRGETACQQLIDFRMNVAADGSMAQIHLFARPPYPQALPEPITIQNQSFQQEVYHAVYSF